MIIGKTRTNQPVEGGQEFEDALLDSETSLENIVDKDGHKRFIEGDIALNDAEEGVILTYGKWSLSGTHLMIVIAGTIANGSELSWKSTFAVVNLPNWVKDKIVPTFADYVDTKLALAYNDDQTSQSLNIGLRKSSENVIYVSRGAITATKDRMFRFTFDLLIDNE